MGTLKTNEEIKKEISETMEELSWVVEGGDAHDLQDACDKAHACLADTLALIERLESDASFYKNISALMDKTNGEALSLIDSLIESNLKRAEKIEQLKAQIAEKNEKIRLLCADIEEAKKKLDCWHDKLDVKIDKVEAGIVQLIQYCKQLEADLEDMTARYKIADDCAKKKGEMNEKLYAELAAVKAERDAAVADLKDCVTEAAQWDDFDCCFACKYNNEYGGCDRPNYTIEACGVEDFDNKWTWRGVQKGKCDV